MTIFGRVISDDVVEDAVKSVLKVWFDTELRVVEEGLGLVARYYERPRSWEIHSDFDKFPEETLPAIIVMSSGVVETARRGTRKIAATWEVPVALVASSRDMDSSRRKAHRMAAAIRASLVHRQSLDGALDLSVRGVEWIGSSNRELDSDADRSVWGIRQVFHVEIEDVMTVSGGPAAPDAPIPDPDQPLPSWPVGETVEITLTKGAIE